MRCAKFGRTIAALIVAATTGGVLPVTATAGQWYQSDFTYEFAPPGPSTCLTCGGAVLSNMCTDGWRVNYILYSENESGLGFQSAGGPYSYGFGCGSFGPFHSCTAGGGTYLGGGSVTAFPCGEDGQPPCTLPSFAVPPDPVGEDCASPSTFCFSEIDYDGDEVVETQEVSRFVDENCRCGNGIKESGESCDDGGSAGGDGCSSTCTVESGWTCTGQPSVCLSSDPLDPDHDLVRSDADGDGRVEPCDYAVLKPCLDDCQAGCGPSNPACADTCAQNNCLRFCDDNCPSVPNGIALGHELAQRDANRDSIGEECQDGQRLACYAGTYEGDNQRWEAVRDAIVDGVESLPGGEVLTVGRNLLGIANSGDPVFQELRTFNNYARAQVVYNDVPGEPLKITQLRVEVAKERKGKRKVRVGVLIWDLEQPSRVYYHDERPITVKPPDCSRVVGGEDCDAAPFVGAKLFSSAYGVKIPRGRPVQITVSARFYETSSKVVLNLLSPPLGPPDISITRRPPDPWCSMTRSLGDSSPSWEDYQGHMEKAQQLLDPWLCEAARDGDSRVKFARYARDLSCEDIDLLNPVTAVCAHRDPATGEHIACHDYGEACDFGSCDVVGYDNENQEILGCHDNIALACQDASECRALGECTDWWRRLCLEPMMAGGDTVFDCAWRLSRDVTGDALWKVNRSEIRDDATNACACDILENDRTGGHVVMAVSQAGLNALAYPQPPSSLEMDHSTVWLCRGDDSQSEGCPTSGW